MTSTCGRVIRATVERLEIDRGGAVTLEHAKENRMRARKIVAAILIPLSLVGIVFIGTVAAEDQTAGESGGPGDGAFAFPLDCVVGESCFLQNLVDMSQDNPLVADTFCGGDTYDEHAGIDIRLRNLRELDRDVSVFAVADGIVRNFRDGMADLRVANAQLVDSVKGQECGNGVMIDHGAGLSTQYCHMKRGSLTVREGMTVKRGERLGAVGVSGLSAFPHLHLSVRQDGRLMDALSGKAMESGNCAPVIDGAGYFDETVRESLIASRDDLIGIGLADRPFPLEALVEGNVPPVPTSSSKAVVGYGWVINAQKGDTMRIRIEADGVVFLESTSKPLDRRKAEYYIFSGRSRSPTPGKYALTVTLIRDGVAVDEKSQDFTIR